MLSVEQGIFKPFLFPAGSSPSVSTIYNLLPAWTQAPPSNSKHLTVEKCKLTTWS